MEPRTRIDGGSRQARLNMAVGKIGPAAESERARWTAKKN